MRGPHRVWIILVTRKKIGHHNFFTRRCAYTNIEQVSILCDTSVSVATYNKVNAVDILINAR